MFTYMYMSSASTATVLSLPMCTCMPTALWTSSFCTNLKDPILNLYMHGKTGEGCCCLKFFLNLQPPNPVPQPLWLHQPLYGRRPGDKVLHLEVRGWERQEPRGVGILKLESLATLHKNAHMFKPQQTTSIKTSPGGLIHWSTSIQHAISFTCNLHSMADMWKTCSMCAKMTSFASIMYEWNHLGLGAFKLTSPDGKASTWVSIQMQNNFEYDLAIGRIFAEYTDKQLINVKDIHKSDRPHCCWLHKLLLTFLNHYLTSIWCRYEMYTQVQLLNLFLTVA